MRAVIQRSGKASVRVDGKTVGEIDRGVVLLLGIKDGDGAAELRWLADKAIKLRIFEDENGKMNRSLQDIDGKMLIISQFTLYGDCRKGRRPGYSSAARPEQARALYHDFIEEVSRQGIEVACGKFQADMEVQLINDGPVTLLLDSEKKF